MKQLQVVMQRMKDAPDDVNVLFGGDTNLRDTEVSLVFPVNLYGMVSS